MCTTWGVKGKDLFLLAVFRRRLEYPALKRAVREQLSLFGLRGYREGRPLHNVIDWQRGY